MEHRGYKCSSLEEFPAGKDVLQMSLESITDSVVCVTVDPNQLKNLHEHIYHQILSMKVEDMKQGYIWGMLEDPEDDLYASYIQPIDFTRPPTMWTKQFEEAIKKQSHGLELTQYSDNDNTILKTIKGCVLEMKSTFHEMLSALQRISLSKVLDIKRLTSFLLSTHGIGVAQSLPCFHLNSTDETTYAMDPTGPSTMAYEQSDIPLDTYRLSFQLLNEAPLTDTIIADESTTFETDEQGTIERRQKQTTSTINPTVPFTMQLSERSDISDDLAVDITSGTDPTFSNMDARVPLLECSGLSVIIDDDDNSSKTEASTLSPVSSCISFDEELYRYRSTDSQPNASTKESFELTYQTSDDTESIEISHKDPLSHTIITIITGESTTFEIHEKNTSRRCQKPKFCWNFFNVVMVSSCFSLFVLTLNFMELT